jgi:hypothetical protein
LRALKFENNLFDVVWELWLWLEVGGWRRMEEGRQKEGNNTAAGKQRLV